MDRRIVYSGALPQDTDVLQPQRNALIALGQVTGAILGAGTWISGLGCIPGAGLSVVIQPGNIFVNGVVDASAFGSIPADAHTITKQAGLMDNAVLNTPAPVIAGHSINYLVQVRYLEVDTDVLVLPYYNSANPAVPLNGPEGTGAAQATRRSSVCDLQILAGVSAATGTQATPAVSAGYHGLAVVTIDYGQEAVLAEDIVNHASRPNTVAKALLNQLLQVDGPGCGLSVDKAVDADTVGGGRWVVVAEGSITNNPGYYDVLLYYPPYAGHHMYMISAYSPDTQVHHGYQNQSNGDFITVYPTSIIDRDMVIADWHGGGAVSEEWTLHYKVWEWR